MDYFYHEMQMKKDDQSEKCHIHCPPLEIHLKFKKEVKINKYELNFA